MSSMHRRRVSRFRLSRVADSSGASKVRRETQTVLDALPQTLPLGCSRLRLPTMSVVGLGRWFSVFWAVHATLLGRDAMPVWCSQGRAADHCVLELEQV